MSGVTLWTWGLVGLSFALYIGIAIWSRAKSTGEFYVAGGGVPAVANGMATAADWMSAASFISMAGIISFAGRDGAVYLMGWTGGYVLLALLLAPYLRRFGKFTVPDFIGDRYYSGLARFVAVVCAIFVSFTYVAGQMRGVGVVFSRFLEVPVNTGVVIGMVIVLFYAVLGGMKGITYTQVAQYCVLIIAFMVPAIFISIMLTNNPIPQLGLGGEYTVDGVGQGVSLLDKLDGLSQELGFAAYTSGNKSTTDVFFITAALMCGTAGLPHVIVRFYTVKKASAARTSALWALLFIAILYTTAPAVAVFARTNLLQSIPGTKYVDVPDWFRNWERTDLICWVDKNGDGAIQYNGSGPAIVGKPAANEELGADGNLIPGANGEKRFTNERTANDNELYIDRDIMVLANPEIAKLPDWVVALVAAGGLAAALSTAAGLLLVISTSVAHDLVKRTVVPILGKDLSDRAELMWARCAAGVAVVIAGYFGVNPPGFVAQVVAFAFGLAASSFFPAIILGIFVKRTTMIGAITGMIVGILFTASYIIFFKFPDLMQTFGITSLPNTRENWWFGISPEGIGTLGMCLNFVVTIGVSLVTPRPPEEVQELVERVRYPRAATGADEVAVVEH